MARALHFGVHAEATSRMHVGVLVNSVGYRYPAVLAKMAATVDVISGGRLEFGIGAGYLESSKEAVTPQLREID